MRTKLNLLQARLWSGLLGVVCIDFPGKDEERATLPTPDGPPAKQSEAIPWTQLGVRAGANYQGDGLAVTTTAEGARLRCAFQRLDGEATHNGLWLTSTVPGQPTDRFCVMAVAVGRMEPRERPDDSPSPLNGEKGWGEG
jgi:hypothetical protein